jgi:hypothetical protein
VSRNALEVKALLTYLKALLQLVIKIHTQGTTCNGLAEIRPRELLW